jgi:hypothetical protein
VLHHGRERVIETWARVHGYPLAWATDSYEIEEVAKILNAKGK